jgi:hypothetical protein
MLLAAVTRTEGLMSKKSGRNGRNGRNSERRNAPRGRAIRLLILCALVCLLTSAVTGSLVCVPLVELKSAGVMDSGPYDESEIPSSRQSALAK